MKKKVVLVLLFVLLVAVTVACISCKNVSMHLTFVVDGEQYKTIDTAGDEVISIPQSPVKDGYTFDGWYWDEGTWQQPFTANSLLNVPLTSDMSVYAKFTKIHVHELTLQPAIEASCTKLGNKAYYICDCGKMFSDEIGITELAAIPTLDKLEHTPSEWIIDKNATCAEDGSKHIECLVCHTTLQTETIESSGHTPETEWKIDSNPTCTIDGSKHLECSVCHVTLQTETIQTSGHVPEVEWIVDSDATCITDGSKHLECSVCHITLQMQVISATGHAYSTEWTSDERGHWHIANCEHTSETTAVEKHIYDSNYKCKICNYKDTSLHGTDIATEIFEVDGEILYAKVPNAQTTFSFINAIQVADGATFVVATDLAASNVIRTKTVSLEIGDNTYYVLVENGNDIQLYTVTLRRRPIYTVTFDTMGGIACDSQQVEEDSLATIPTTTRTGYTFANWDYDFEQPITDNLIITASWTANEYTITYDVNGGDLSDTQYTATYNSEYILAVPTREGHTFLGWYIGEIKIANPDGQSTEIWTYSENKTATAQWNINSYSVIINYPDGAGTITGVGTYIYGTVVTVTASEPNLGYDFLGWYNGDELLSTKLTYTFDLPATDVTLFLYRVRDEMSNFTFTSTYTTCEITGVKDKTVTDITIPYYVTSIGNSAFSNCTNLAIVYWNATACTYAGSNYYPIFKGCSKLTTVIIGDDVTSIGNYAFYGCSELTSVTIPDNVTFIGNYAFCKCSSLETVYWNATACTITGSNYYSIFKDCSKLATVVIGNNVTSIPRYAFCDCSNLTSITIPNSVTSIGSSAFRECNNLKVVYYIGTLTDWCNKDFSGWESNPLSYAQNLYINNGILSGDIVIPEGITTIPSYTFKNSAITSVTIPDSVTTIGSSAFYGCSNLTSVYYTGDIADWCNISFDSLGANPLYYAQNLYINNELVTELVIPDTVTEIKTYAFYGCTSITKVVIPNSVTSIGSSAFKECTNMQTVNWNATSCISVGSFNYPIFENCSKLTTVVIGDNVTSIPRYAFYNCSNLTSVTIGNSVTSIGESAFSGCSSLTNVIIPDSVMSISNYAFSSCSNLTSVTIGGSVKTIGERAFNNCSNLETVYWNATACASAGSYSYPIFKNCSELTTVVIGDTVIELPSYTFYNCGYLKTVTIGGGVMSIGKEAFYGCGTLNAVYYRGTVADWCNISFVDYTANPLYYAHNLYIDNELVTELVIPNTIMKISDAFRNCTSIKSVTISNSVKSIGEFAFSGCSSLTSITIGNSVTSIGDYAFNYCRSITSVTIPNSVKSIGESAFSGCSSLTSITIPDSVITIGDSAFSNCSSLTSITIPNSITRLGVVFNGCSNLYSITLPFVGDSVKTSMDNEQYPFGYIFGTKSYTKGIATKQEYYGSSTSSTTSTTYYIPSTLKSVTITGGNILYGAFYNCSGLTSVTIGDDVKYIGDYAFKNCSGLKTVYWNANVSTNDRMYLQPIFSGCSNITTVAIGDNVTAIPSYVFYDFNSLTKVIYAGTISDWCNISFGSYSANPLYYAHNLYIDNKLVTDIEIPNTVSEIKYCAFNGCTSIKSVRIPNSVKSIGAWAFSQCSGLTSVTMGSSVTEIGQYAFQSCDGLKEITIPNSVTKIGDSAFNNCSNLNKVYWNAISCTIVGSTSNSSIFTGCNSLTEVIVGNNVTSIPSHLFLNCNLIKVTIGNNVKSIGYSAFGFCRQLKAVYYNGLSSDWASIQIDSGNDYLLNATRYYTA